MKNDMDLDIYGYDLDPACTLESHEVRWTELESFFVFNVSVIE